MIMSYCTIVLKCEIEFYQWNNSLVVTSAILCHMLTMLYIDIQLVISKWTRRVVNWHHHLDFLYILSLLSSRYTVNPKKISASHLCRCLWNYLSRISNSKRLLPRNQMYTASNILLVILMTVCLCAILPQSSLLPN